MQALIYIMVFLSLILIVSAIFSIVIESIRLKDTKKIYKLDLEKEEAHEIDVIRDQKMGVILDTEELSESEATQYQKIANLFDTIMVSDIEYSLELEKILKSFKRLEMLNNPKNKTITRNLFWIHPF